MAQLAFTTEEYRERVSRVQAVLLERGIDLLLVHSPENILYLSGYQTSGYFAYQVLAVPSQGEPRLLVRDIEASNAVEYAWLSPSSTMKYSDRDDPVAATATIAAEAGASAGVIGMEHTAWFLTIRDYERLTSLMPAARIVDASHLVDRLRLIKSPSEVAYIRRAAAIVDAGMEAAVNAIEDGAREADVAAEVHAAEIRMGCEYVGLPHFISSGYRIRLGHANWSERRMETGDAVHLELSGCIRRYSAALMRTACVGRPSKELARTADLLRVSQDAAIRLMRPGVEAGIVDAACRRPIVQSGLRPDYHQRTGYSIGLGFPPKWGEWDICDFREGDSWQLQAGMVFHMILSAQGICFSETVLITESGHEMLTSSPRELVVA